jgi:uncharacterized protein (TIGR02996 family)
MTPANAFLHAILDEPADDDLRLIFADWLQDRGDARGEFLRSQVMRSRWVPDVHRREAMHERERELLATHGDAWLGELSGFCRSWQFERGMVRSTMDARRFVTQRFEKASPALFFQAWVARLRLVKATGYVGRIASAPPLALLRSLDLSGNRLGDDDVVVLSRSSGLTQLRHLDLSHNQIGSLGLAALMASPWLERLTWLDLRHNQLSHPSPRTIEQLLHSPLGQRLHRLDLDGNDLDHEAERAYFDWRRERDIGPRPARFVNAVGMELAMIPAGSFLMGSPENEEKRGGDEGPQHLVEITRPFYLGVCHVTQRQYTRLMGNNPSAFDQSRVPARDNPAHLPVDTVAPEDCRLFCERLSQLPDERLARHVYRLATEAEWEHACRAGAPSDWPFTFGTSLASVQANFRGNEPYGDAPEGARLERPTPGGIYPANALGLYDMHGNMWDWVADYYAADYYQNSPRQDPPGPESNPRSVLKGGSWLNAGHWCRSASRFGSTNDSGSSCISFRVAMDAP